MTKERRKVHERRCNDPKGQDEVYELLAEIDRDRQTVYRLLWLQDWANTFRAAETLFETKRARTPEWFQAGIWCLKLMIARVELDSTPDPSSARMPSIPQHPGVTRTRPRRGEAGIAKIAWYFLHYGEYRVWPDRSLPVPDPVWSLSEFRALAKAMEWGDAAKDATGVEGSRSMKELGTAEFMRTLPDHDDFGRLLNLLFWPVAECDEEPLDTTADRHAALTATSFSIGVEALLRAADMVAEDPVLEGILLRAPTSGSLKSNLPLLQSRLGKIQKALGPGDTGAPRHYSVEELIAIHRKRPQRDPDPSEHG